MIHIGDCLEVMRTLPANSVDAIVTDPPYGLGFMGKHWDHGVPGPDFWREMLRVAKPGAYLVAFGGSRTHHRMACAIEDAGWEIRDTIMWLYGSGFPKSLNIGDGRGTALKPAHEPIVLARKPLIGTVAENLARFGTGVLNIDDCRVLTDENLNGGAYAASGGRSALDGDERIGAAAGMFQPGKTAASEFVQPAGRWPANIIHDGSDEVLAAFPSAPGQRGDLKETGRSRPSSGRFGDMAPPHAHPARIDTDTSAARFFYCAKASRQDRSDGLDKSKGNHHPTVKPTNLMRWLCRLVTPAGGVVLDPFMGSGSTGRAALMEGFQFVGIEMDPGYAAIAEARIRTVQLGLSFGEAV